MNTAVKTHFYNQSPLAWLDASPFGSLQEWAMSTQGWCVTLLLIMIFISSIGVVYVQEQNRILFSALTAAQKQRDALYVEWGQLLLEESTWSTQPRVQRIAEQQLNMLTPKQKQIVIVQT